MLSRSVRRSRVGVVRSVAGLTMVFVVLVGLTGCGTSGRDLRSPATNSVSPTRSSVAVTSTTVPSLGTVVPPMVTTSTIP